MANQYYNAGQSQMTKNKVFINPNYNRKATDNTSHLNTMYLNPHFCKPTSHISYQNNDVTRSKIYVNPNFLRNSSHQMNSKPILNYPTTTHANVIEPVSNVLYQYSNTSTITTPTQVTPEKQTSTHITKSRYSLVNKQENKIKPIIKQTNTISVNKYKLIPLRDVQSKLYTEKKFNVPTTDTSEVRPPINNYKSKIKPILQNLSSNRFKLIRQNATNLNTSISKLKIRRTSILNKSLTKPFTPPRKVVKDRRRSVLKKNNIPCPLFKKYGKCLRRTRGICEYLHDKKHVSICRKFLKGICHDDYCLLSHDLTDKKMPTCHFYLQGLCTKENCPYLHVKLNEKASVCLDFLKGYCEKGDKCLNRHVNIACRGSKDKNLTTKLIRRKSSVNIKTKLKLKTSKEDIKLEGKEGIELNSVSETRYFKEAIVIDANSDLIRPTRCKLGSLPSFIQL